MKKAFFITLMVVQTGLSAQWTDNGSSITTTDKVGIGTTTPSSELEIKSITGNDAEIHINAGSDGDQSIIRFLDQGQRTWGLLSNYPHTGKFSLYNYQLGTNSIVFDSNGNVGIGTSSPGTKLHIFGSNVGSGNILSSVMLGKQNGPEIQAIQEATDDDIQGLAFRVKSSGAFVDSNFEAMRINRSGNVGIGTTAPDAKLAVNGDIHAKEVKVDLVGWPDYVFDKNYELPSLEEVEAHIVEKGHLQDIPSAQEVMENGIQLGEMDAKLLQKIEELMLYTIKQQKEIQTLKAQNQDLQKQLNQIRSR
ncbi:tail fiber protein [Muricauda sp. SCSIO 64092]|uniref:tail fiber protein n=1 Tax=Allomuricauda sp. SCSIO 64092 TaxID=2908842 RepID=UPI001FF607A4|nr:tail fiber protein [Muricauda sp. SCSIO 64092]UOY05177.1 tail fiber protein [Muricauda sp. SCSIO 64092]